MPYPHYHSAFLYNVRNANEANLELDMNSMHQVLSYKDEASLIGNGIRALGRNSDVLLNACTDIDLAEKIEKNYLINKDNIHKNPQSINNLNMWKQHIVGV